MRPNRATSRTSTAIIATLLLSSTRNCTSFTTTTFRHLNHKHHQSSSSSSNAVCLFSSSSSSSTSTPTRKLLLLRHGESQTNKSNVFTGWNDVPLSQKGILDSLQLGTTIYNNGLRFNTAYISLLGRAETTLALLLSGYNAAKPKEIKPQERVSNNGVIPRELAINIKRNWQLNERHYGDLQGYSKTCLNNLKSSTFHLPPDFGNTPPYEVNEMVIMEWRRGFNLRPPVMRNTHPHYNDITNDERYKGLENVPRSESLKDTQKRVVGFYRDVIVNALWHSSTIPLSNDSNNNTNCLLIVSHANALRSLIMHFDGISEEDIKAVNIPTAKGFVYEIGEDGEVVSSIKKGEFRGKFLLQ